MKLYIYKYIQININIYNIYLYIDYLFFIKWLNL